MDDLEASKARAQIARQGRIPTQGPELEPICQIDGGDTVFPAPPSKRTVLGWFGAGLIFQAFVETPVRGEHRDFVSHLRESFGKRKHLRRWTTEFEEWFIALRDVQDSHNSRSILRNALAKTGKRNSFSNLSRPRFPISRACSGLASRASNEVASWVGSPCCTRWPVRPSWMTWGGPPCAP